MCVCVRNAKTGESTWVMPKEADNHRVDVGMAAVASTMRNDTASAYKTRDLAGDTSVSLADSAAVPRPHPDTVEIEVRDSEYLHICMGCCLYLCALSSSLTNARVHAEATGAASGCGSATACAATRQARLASRGCRPLSPTPTSDLAKRARCNTHACTRTHALIHTHTHTYVGGGAARTPGNGNTCPGGRQQGLARI